MRPHVKQYKSIVLLGKFNPTIFQPFWFVAQKLIGKQDGDKRQNWELYTLTLLTSS